MDKEMVEELNNCARYICGQVLHCQYPGKLHISVQTKKPIEALNDVSRQIFKHWRE